MLLYMLVFMLLFFVVFLMLMLNMLISKKLSKNREKSSPFECGFDPQSDNRMPFSLQFYLISIIFLIFDIEIAMILPMVESLEYYNYLINLNCMIIIFILLVGLFLEWKEGALKWFK